MLCNEQLYWVSALFQPPDFFRFGRGGGCYAVFHRIVTHFCYTTLYTTHPVSCPFVLLKACATIDQGQIFPRALYDGVKHHYLPDLPAILSLLLFHQPLCPGGHWHPIPGICAGLPREPVCGLVSALPGEEALGDLFAGAESGSGRCSFAA